MANSPAFKGITNRILLSLPEAALNRIWPALEFLNMTRGDLIDRADRSIENIYFVNRGLISLVKSMQDGRTVEIGVVGPEGITNPHSLFGLNRSKPSPSSRNSVLHQA